MHAPSKSSGPSAFQAFVPIAQRGIPFITMGAQTFGCHTSGGVRMIDPFASQNLPPTPQPQAEKGLTNPREIHSTLGFCVTTPPAPAAFLGSLTLPTSPFPPNASDTIESTPLIEIIPHIPAPIVAKSGQDLARTVQPLAAWEREAALRLPARRDFRAALAARPPAIIAEIKKASPSKGVLSHDFAPARIAGAYERGGAAALSVLTDETFFQGSLADLESARAAVSLPVLRKDFTIDAVQILEAAAHGADAILLIAAILSARQMREFRETAAGYRLSALVEVHNRRELDAAIDAGADLIGVNNRNLATFEVTLETSLAPARRGPPRTPAVE